MDASDFVDVTTLSENTRDLLTTRGGNSSTRRIGGYRYASRYRGAQHDLGNATRHHLGGLPDNGRVVLNDAHKYIGQASQVMTSGIV